MDVALLDELDCRPTLLTISQYLALPPQQRPSHLQCAGRAGAQRCGGAVFPKAINDGPVAPHFASLNHLEGCDHATRPRLSRLTTESAAESHAGPLHLTATPCAPRTAAIASSAHVGPGHGASRASLQTALRVLTGTGLPPELFVQWHQHPPLLAYEFFIHLASATTPQDQPRGYWGQIHHARHRQQTGSVHLVPRHGPPIVIGARTSAELGLPDPVPLAGATVLAVGPLRQSRSGRLYVLLTQPSGLAWLQRSGA